MKETPEQAAERRAEMSKFVRAMNESGAPRTSLYWRLLSESLR